MAAGALSWLEKWSFAKNVYIGTYEREVRGGEKDGKRGKARPVWHGGQGDSNIKKGGKSVRHRGGRRVHRGPRPIARTSSTTKKF